MRKVHGNIRKAMDRYYTENWKQHTSNLIPQICALYALFPPINRLSLYALPTVRVNQKLLVMICSQLIILMNIPGEK